MTNTTQQFPINLPVFDTIRLGFAKVSGAKKTIWGAFLVIFLIVIGIQILAQLIGHISLVLGVIVNIIGKFINFLLMAGMIYIGIQRASDLPIEYKQIFRVWEFNRALNIIGLYLLKMIIFAAFIIPMLATISFMGVFHVLGVLFAIIVILMLYVALRMSLSIAFVLDQNVSPFRAIALSFHVTKRNVWRLLGFTVTLFIIFTISMIPLGIGLIWTMPMMYICYGLAYKTLLLNVQSQ